MEAVCASGCSPIRGRATYIWAQPGRQVSPMGTSVRTSLFPPRWAQQRDVGPVDFRRQHRVHTLCFSAASARNLPPQKFVQEEHVCFKL